MSKIQLTQTCNIATGKLDSNAAEDNGAYPYFTCAPEPLRINTYAFDDDVILLAGNNASGNFHCQRYNGKFNAYQRTYVITSKSGYDINYVYYNLLINLSQLRKKAQGSQTKFLTMQILNAFEIEDIPYGEQRKLAAILVALDNKISNNNKINTELESMAKTIYDYWFLQFEFPNDEGKPYKSSGGKMVWNEELKRVIPEGWEVARLAGKFDIERGLSYKSKDIESGEGIPMLNLACIDTKRNYRNGELKYYTGNIDDSYYLDEDDLLIACTDLTRNADIVGCPILTPGDDKKYTFTMDLAKIIPDEKVFDKYYLYMTLRTDFYHNYIKKWASGTNVLHLNLDGIGWYKTWIPPTNIQKKISGMIKDINQKKGKILLENQQLSSLRDFLLPLLMNGQVGF